jgi:hypothetical protein
LQVAPALLQPHSFEEGNWRRLIRDIFKAAEFGAKAEALDAELERGAVAAEETLEEGFEFDGAGDGLIDFAELVGGEFFPAGTDGSVVAEAAEEEFDFSEGEAHVGGEADEKDAMKGVAGIASLAADALGRSEEAEFFVVADGGGIEASTASEFTDFHFRMLSGCESLNVLCPHSKALDLKLALSFSIQEWDVANPIWRKAMNSKKERFGKVSKKGAAAAGAALALLIANGGAAAVGSQGSSTTANMEKQVTTTHSKFYCNVKALNPAERARHKQLSEKLIAARKEIVETAKGYEFQFSPKNVSLAELADWVSAESKCCPFFDFHIDLEGEGSLLCLRLTGEEGIKAFIRAEFAVE